MRRRKSTCYMCDKPATTREHVPPLCFFPEPRDIGTDYRKNLVTVPACDEHNLKRSTDDEYILAVVAFHWRNNRVAYTQSVTKLKRALGYSKKYYDLFFGEGRHTFFVWNGQALVTSTVDIERINASFQKIARGIYFHHFKEKFLGNVDIQHFSLAALYQKHDPVITELTRATHMMRLLCMERPKTGNNPDIFYYQIAQDEPPTDRIMRMIFYSGFEVLALFNGQSHARRSAA